MATACDIQPNFFSEHDMTDKTHVSHIAVQPPKLQLTHRVRVRNERGLLCILTAGYVGVGSTLDGVPVVGLANDGRRWFGVGYISGIGRAMAT